MCILCVVSRWSRRIVTMLPWLVIPFIIMWAFSQLLAPGYRLEVTSTRLACLVVLLGSLGWYELLMPWLSSWRAHRSAMMRERRLIEAQEAAKWRKEATRRCRNCFTPYKVQAPGCGKFMCTYCGHISKRPVLEVPASLSGSQLITGTGTLPYKGSPGRHDTGCWSRSSERKSCWLRDGACGGDNCKAWQSVLVLSHVGSLFSLAGNMWRTFTGGKYSAEGSRGCQKVKDEVASSHESRGEKARKKANERRQARLEKEFLEIEERKQREDVARMVEERSRQREEKHRVEIESEREAAAEREREIRRVKELERRRKDKVKIKKQDGDQPEARSEHVTCALDCSTNCTKEFVINEAANLVDPSKLATLHGGSTNCDQGVRGKVASGAATKSDLPKHLGTVKKRPVSGSQMGSVSRNNGSLSGKADTLWSGGKGGKLEAAISPSSTRLSQNSPGESALSDLELKKTPWVNAWAKGIESIKERCGKAQSVPVSSCGERLHQHAKEGGNVFNNKAVGAKQPTLTVGSTAIQPPIAPPSTQNASLHQLFSIPTIFPPLDSGAKFSGQSEQMSQSEINASFIPEHTFFETPACPFQPCTHIAGISVSLPPLTPVLAQDSILSSCQPPLNVLDASSLFTDAPQDSPLLGAKFLGQREQMSQSGIKASFIPEHTFFESPASPSFQPCTHIAGISVSLPPSTPVLAQDSILTPCQPPLNVLDASSLLTDAPQDSPALGSVKLAETFITAESKCNPTSPHTVSGSDAMECELLAKLSPTSTTLKPDGSNLNVDKDDAVGRELLPDCAENIEVQMWTALQVHNRKVNELMDSSQNKSPVDQEVLHLPHLSTVQSLFDSENVLPESLSLSPQNEGKYTLNCEEIACATQLFDRKSLWSDVSAFNAAVQIWEEAENHEKLPPEFVDCITQEIMRDPVITADGHSYERTAIEKWLKHHDTSPKTGEVLPPPPGGKGVDKTLRPNHILRGQIIEYTEKLAKIQLSAVSWSNTSKDGDFFASSTSRLLSFQQLAV